MAGDRNDKDRRSFIQAITNQRLVIIGATFVVALALSLLAFGLSGWSRPWSEVFGLIGTLWALGLAILIYWISANDTSDLLDQIESLSGSLLELSSRLPRQQDPRVLAAARKKFPKYVQALLEKYPAIPESDITAIERLQSKGGDGRGNAPVIITTRLRRYSVWHGGRGGGYHVTRLGEAAEAADH